MTSLMSVSYTHLDVYKRQVKNVCKNKKIVVRDGDKIILEKKRKHMIPSEMESININKELLKQITGNISVSVEEA